ncbi:MAG: sugar phosphate isomerase/epimerase [Phycisphaerales bacterium]|nr:MAG: sugar phosphate isomerase/epimerase [Phycisphaerales bacterium]
MINTLTANPGTETSIPDLCERTIQAGLDAIALHVGDGLMLSFDATDARCREIRGAVEAAGLRIAALLQTCNVACHFGSRNPAIQHQAVECTQAALDLAAWLGTEVLVVEPAVVRSASSGPDNACSYVHALNGTHAALQRLRFAAERRGVSIAVTAARNRFLLSPVELRDLIDEQAAPNVGACLDVAACAAFGRPEDWIHTLGPRIRCLCLGGQAAPPALDDAAEPSTAFHGVYRALLDVGYAGPLCCPGEPMSRWLAATSRHTDSS